MLVLFICGWLENVAVEGNRHNDFFFSFCVCNGVVSYLKRKLM